MIQKFNNILLMTLLLSIGQNSFSIFAQENMGKEFYFKSNSDVLLFVDSSTTNNMKIFGEATEYENRNGYAYLTIGIADLFGIGIGYQIDEDYAIGLKWGSYWISSEGGHPDGGIAVPSGGVGFGIRVSRSINNKIINSLNFETTLFHSLSYHNRKNFIKGAAFDLNFGNQSKLKNGLNFMWSVGITTSIAKEIPTLFMPNLKIGFTFNF